MKRFFAIVVTCTIILCLLPFSAQATETSTERTYFEDGSYVVTETTISTTRMLTKVGSRTRTYYSADDIRQWKITITAEFLYDGTTATCTYASGTTTIYNTSHWRKVSDYASYSGNNGRYTATLEHIVLGVTVDTFDTYVDISCDENGNFY